MEKRLRSNGGYSILKSEDDANGRPFATGQLSGYEVLHSGELKGERK